MNNQCSSCGLPYFDDGKSSAAPNLCKCWTNVRNKIGWQCPRCGAGLAPWVKSCDCAKPWGAPGTWSPYGSRDSTWPEGSFAERIMKERLAEHFKELEIPVIKGRHTISFIYESVVYTLSIKTWKDFIYAQFPKRKEDPNAKISDYPMP